MHICMSLELYETVLTYCISLLDSPSTALQKYRFREKLNYREHLSLVKETLSATHRNLPNLLIVLA